MSNNRIGIYLSDEMIEACDANIKRFDAKSRSDLINTALEHLFTEKDSEITSNILIPALESSIRAAAHMSVSDVTKMMFKLSVEVDMMMHIIAATHDIDDITLGKLRGMCVEEVKRTYGNISFESAYKHQKG